MKKTNKFKMGPIQKLWVSQLKKHPERQTDSILGTGTPKSYKACCLGELLVCAARVQKKKLPFANGHILDSEGENFTLKDSYSRLGLRSSDGEFELEFKYLKNHSSLAGLNDNDFTWPQIAAIVERNPGNVFTKSV